MAEPLYRVSGLDLAFSKNTKIESAPTADQEPLDHITSPEFDCELKARHARLSYYDLRFSNTKAVADIDVYFQQPFGRKIFAKHPASQLHGRQFVSPIFVVL